jgi:hypothetical protein
MNVTLACAYNSNYVPLGAITWGQNKKVYAERYGFNAELKIWDKPRINPSWEKMFHIKELFSDPTKNIDWLWATGCDSMITNFDIDVRDIIDNNYHFMITSDINSYNADSFFIRNSPEGNAFLNDVLQKANELPYQAHPPTGTGQFEQGAIIDVSEKYKDIIKEFPQRAFNSYDYSYLPWPSPQLDKTGNPGNWMQGDFVIHFPAMTLTRRIKYAEHYSNCIMGVNNPLLW